MFAVIHLVHFYAFGERLLAQEKDNRPRNLLVAVTSRSECTSEISGFFPARICIYTLFETMGRVFH